MKALKVSISVLAATCLTTGCLLVASTVDEAQAASLSTKSITIAAGGKQTVKLKSGKGKWTIKNTAVAKLASKKKTSVVVKPKKAGTTTLVCKVGKKKLKCTVKVLNNKIGDVTKTRPATMLVGKSQSYGLTLAQDNQVTGTEYDASLAKVTVKTSGNRVNVKIKALKPGNLQIVHHTSKGEDIVAEGNLVPNFRGKAKVKKTDKNYKKWRKSFIKQLVDSDMPTWEIIDCVGYLISTGTYSMKGETSGRGLWYSGKGSCVSGAEMMDDFLHDLGITSKVRFAGNDKSQQDIYGMTMYYGSEHENTKIKLGGKTYILNPQPESQWPYGIIAK